MHHLQQVWTVPVYRMPIAGSRKVQVCKRQRDEAEGERCESHNPSAAQPVLVPPLPSASPLLLSQATRHSQHPSGEKEEEEEKEKENTPFQVPVTLTTGWIGVTCKWLRVLQLKSHCDETHLGIFTCVKSIRTSDACPPEHFSKSHLLFCFPSSFTRKEQCR